MPEPRNPNEFEPPTAAQLSDHLALHPPSQTAGWRGRMPVIVLAVLGMALLVVSSPVFALLPWLGLMGLMVYLSSRARTMRELQHRVTQAWELTMIRRYREALRRAWELLPACKSQPELHGRVVTVIAHILGELGQDESAEVAYGYLLDRLPPDHPLSLRLNIQRAIVALCSDQLADADDALRKLRSRAEASPDQTLAASYHMARLLQDVRTGHYADAIEHADQTAEALRPLGIEAGYGHGLLALCFHQLATHDPAVDQTQRTQLHQLARRWWDNATLLIAPAALVFRHPDLLPLPEHLGKADQDADAPDREAAD